MKNVKTIWKKELKDTIRDRRTLFAMIILPMFLMPLLFIGIGKLAEYQIKDQEDKIVTVALANGDAASEFVSMIKEVEKIDIVDVEGGVREAIENDEADVGLIIPENFQQSIADQIPVQVMIVRNSINLSSSTTLNRLNQALVAYNNAVRMQRFESADIDTEILNGVSFVIEDVATEKEVGGFSLGFILPLFIIMWAIVGGQYTAIDVSAGEKERRTLESLLLTPVKKMDIVIGKFLAVSTTALISVVVALTSMYVAITAFGLGKLATSGSPDGIVSLDFSIDPTTLLILFGISILLVLMFSAIQLSIAIFAKSYKEAQSYIGPSYLIVILPTVIVNTLPDFEPALWFFTLPVVNAVLLFKEVLIGVYDSSHILVTSGSLVIFVAISIYISTKIYSREGVLFRD